MTATYSFIFPLASGLHARPASALADIAESFVADVRLVNERTGIDVNAKSMLSMISSDVRKGDACQLFVTGEDERAAYVALRDWIDQVLPHESPLPARTLRQGEATLPRGLASDTLFMSGTVIHPGIGKGSVVFLRGASLPEPVAQHASLDPALENETLAVALKALRSQMERQLTKHTATAAAVMKAHLSVLNDRAFLDQIQQGIQQGRTAEQAIIEAGHFFIQALATGSQYIRERAVDLQEICLQLLQQLHGHEIGTPSIKLTEPSILVADQLGPHQLLELDRRYLNGLIIGELSETSHAAILARAFNIPTVSGIPGTELRTGQPVIVDAQAGLLIPSPTDSVIRYYQKEAAVRSLREKRMALHASAPAMTTDGNRLDVAANISTAEEVERAMELGADGIGLFRTEMLYVSHDHAPTEEAQVDVYRKALLHAAGHAVILRTVDIGGDKPVSYLNLPKEDNPFLGYRGVRIYPDHQDLFETQLRAILRASAHGKLRMMIPMVSSVEELRWVKQRIAILREQFTATGVPFDSDMEIGVMIETPSAVFSIRALSSEADFFSIGTNDLSQYFFAADRTNPRVSGLCCVRHPAFLRLLSYATTEARACGKWIGLCGEMAGDPINLPLLIGLRLQEISTGAAGIPQLKQKVGELSAATCHERLEKSLHCSTTTEVETLLAQTTLPSNQRFLETDLIVLDSDSATKDEAIRELANRLYIAGRTEDPSAIEEAIWVREEIGVTGLGFGFGVPHCKSDAMKSHSIGISRFRQPIAWNPAEDEPVRMIILLALRQSGSDHLHMKIFSKLARKLMHTEFRQQLLDAESEEAVVLFLEQELGL